MRCVFAVLWSGSFQGGPLSQGAIFVYACVSASMYSASVALRVISLQAWGCLRHVRDGRRLYFEGQISPLPSAQDFFFCFFLLLII